MPPYDIDCRQLTKTYVHDVMPSSHLQDHLLKPHLFAGKWQQQAVNNVTLQVQPGEWIGVQGHNGSGKTTLLKLIAGLLQPSSGDVVCDKKIVALFTLGAGFQPDFSAPDNIRFYCLLHGIHPSEIPTLTTQIIAFAGIESHIGLPLKCYSTGMQQRLAYAAATHINADIYLFDEIMAVGDEDFQQKCKAHLRVLKDRGKTVLIVSHTRSKIEPVCDRIITLENGSMVREEVL